MTKEIVMVEILVNEDAIEDLYPNFVINYDTPDEFIASLKDSLKTNNYTRDGKTFDHLAKYGYSIKVI